MPSCANASGMKRCPVTISKPTVGLLLASTLWLAGSAAATEPVRLDVPKRAIEPAKCPIDIAPALAGRTQCGLLRVPENRAVDTGRTVTIAFAVVQPEQAVAGQDPTLFIMGGNGSGLKNLKRQPALAEQLARNAAVIYADHRGSTSWGQPDMSCPGFAEGLDAAAANADPVQVAACRKHLGALLDVNLYGPYEAALDLRDLRLALGLPRWNVYGVSYGTTIGQRLLGVDGRGIGAIVPDGMAGADSNAYAESYLLDPLLDLLDECAAAPDCSRAFPRFEQNLAKVAAQLGRRPVRLDGAKVSNVEYLARVRSAMRDPDRRGRIPLAVERSARGDHSLWQGLAVAEEDGPSGRDPAFTWPSSVCRDEYPRRNSPENQQAARRALPAAVRSGVRLLDGESYDWENFCARLGFRASAPETVVIHRSDIPALMLIGQLDLVTPKTWSDRATRALDNARTVVFPLTDHFVLLRQPRCASDLIQSFFQDPAAALDRRCVDTLPITHWTLQAPP